MSREIDLLRAEQAGLPLGESRPDAPLVCFPLKIDMQMANPADTHEPFPAPRRTSRADPPKGYAIPRSAMQLAEFAREASWEVRVQVSEGRFPHGSTGRPGALKEVIALRFGEHPMTDRRAYAVYSRMASGGTWGWSSFMIWGPDLAPFAGCFLADLKAYLGMAPEMPTNDLVGWVAGLKGAIYLSEEARKRRMRVRAQIAKVSRDGRFEAARQESRLEWDRADQAWRSKVRDLADGVFTLEELEKIITPKVDQVGMW